MPRERASEALARSLANAESPLWDTSPITLGGWLSRTISELFNEERNYFNLLINGFVIYKGTAYFPNKALSFMTDRSSIALGTFDKGKITPIDPAQPCQIGGSAVADLSKYTMPNDHAVSMIQWQNVDGSLGTAIAARIEDKSEGEALLASAGRSGIRLIGMLQGMIQALTPGEIQVIEEFVADTLKKGLPRVTISAFNQVKNIVYALNQSSSTPESDDKIVHKLEMMVHNTSESVSNSLQSKIDVKAGVCEAKSVAMTSQDRMNCIKQVIQQIQARALQNEPGATPRANRATDASDPIKDGRHVPGAPRAASNVWHERMRNCQHCKDDPKASGHGKPGQHLDNDCPKKKAEEAAAAKSAKKATKAVAKAAKASKAAEDAGAHDDDHTTSTGRGLFAAAAATTGGIDVSDLNDLKNDASAEEVMSAVRAKNGGSYGRALSAQTQPGGNCSEIDDDDDDDSDDAEDEAESSKDGWYAIIGGPDEGIYNEAKAGADQKLRPLADHAGSIIYGPACGIDSFNAAKIAFASAQGGIPPGAPEWPPFELPVPMGIPADAITPIAAKSAEKSTTPVNTPTREELNTTSSMAQFKQYVQNSPLQGVRAVKVWSGPGRSRVEILGEIRGAEATAGWPPTEPPKEQVVSTPVTPPATSNVPQWDGNPNTLPAFITATMAVLSPPASAPTPSRMPSVIAATTTAMSPVVAAPAPAATPAAEQSTHADPAAPSLVTHTPQPPIIPHELREYDHDLRVQLRTDLTAVFDLANQESDEGALTRAKLLVPDLNRTGGKKFMLRDSFDSSTRKKIVLSRGLTATIATYLRAHIGDGVFEDLRETSSDSDILSAPTVAAVTDMRSTLDDIADAIYNGSGPICAHNKSSSGFPDGGDASNNDVLINAVAALLVGDFAEAQQRSVSLASTREQAREQARMREQAIAASEAKQPAPVQIQSDPVGPAKRSSSACTLLLGAMMGIAVALVVPYARAAMHHVPWQLPRPTFPPLPARLTQAGEAGTQLDLLLPILFIMLTIWPLSTMLVQALITSLGNLTRGWGAVPSQNKKSAPRATTSPSTSTVIHSLCWHRLSRASLAAWRRLNLNLAIHYSLALLIGAVLSPITRRLAIMPVHLSVAVHAQSSPCSPLLRRARVASLAAWRRASWAVLLITLFFLGPPCPPAASSMGGQTTASRQYSSQTTRKKHINSATIAHVATVTARGMAQAMSDVMSNGTIQPETAVKAAQELLLPARPQPIWKPDTDQPASPRALQASGRPIQMTKSSQLYDNVIKLTMDSGATWHGHFIKKDLINYRPLAEVIEGIGKAKCRVVGIGDLPIVARDTHGQLHHLLIKDVRHVPAFTDTLISVQQLWDQSQTDVRFRDIQQVQLPERDGYMSNAFAFKRDEGVYMWRVHRGNQEFERIRVLSSKAYSPHSTDHVARLPDSLIGQVLHRRLHLPHDKLRGLHKATKDAPKFSGNMFDLPCSACTEAAAVATSHKTARYEPSYVGRQVHGDVVGPFIKSAVGHLQWALIIVDDHSRYKHVYFLRTKDEAPAMIRKYVAEVNAVASAKAGKPVKVVSHFNSDNAGEFLSRSFTEFLDLESIKHTTCPPYVHQLNGVAERAIRSVMDLARTALAASGAPKSFWPYAVAHAVDILNRTTGPPVGPKSSHEIVTGKMPKVMDIMPFGCRSFALKPRNLLRKSELEYPAHVGVNLGKDDLSPGAFLTWVPALSKIVSTSDTSFDESLFPWRPENSQRVGPVMPTAAPPYQPPKTSNVSSVKELPQTSIPTAKPDDAQHNVRNSNKVLILFSGKYNRPDGIAAFLRPLGLDCVQIDNDEKGGDPSHDLLNDEFYDSLLAQVKSGQFRVIFAAPPCSTFSVARFLEKPDSPPPVRDRKHVMGLPDLSPAYRAEVKRANALVARTCILLSEGFKVGTQFALENPADHGDAARHTRFLHERHCPVWLFPEVSNLSSTTSAKLVTFSMCAFGSPWRKDTSLLYTDGLSKWLNQLSDMKCTHTRHEGITDKNDAGEWKSKSAAAYPPDFNFFIARAIGSVANKHRAESDVEPVADHAPAQAPVVEKTAPAPVRAPEPPKPVNTVPDGARVEILYSPDGRWYPATISDVRISGSHREHQIVWDDAEGVEWSKVPQWVRLASETWRPFSVASAPIEPSPSEVPKAIEKPRPVYAPGRESTRSRKPVLARGLVALMSVVHLSSAFHAKPTMADPKSRPEAMAMDEKGWFQSEENELCNHESNESWKHVDRSVWRRTKRKLVKMVWVYKVKRNGTLKSRLCVQGCSQIPGIDYDQTYCAAMRPGSMRLLAALAAEHQLRMHRWDFKAAYLQGDLLEGEVVYCQPPPGYREHGRTQTGADGEEQVLCVQRPIYGMAQAGRRWQRTLFPWLTAQGFTQHHADPCVFSRVKDGQRLMIGVYVDDLCICHGSTPAARAEYDGFVSSLNSRWEVDDEGELTDLLGVEFEFDGDNVKLHQSQYIQKMVKEHLPDGAPSNLQSYRVPCDVGLPLLIADALSNDHERNDALVKRYQSLVGALLYCSTNTRPDIAFTVNMLCRAMAKPTPELLGAAEHALLYLFKTKDLGLTYAASATQLTGYSDSDWGIQHSISGWTFQLSRATISWGSKRQTSVALSSCEAEIMAASEAAKEAVYLDRFLAELGEPRNGPIPLNVDNTGARNLAYNPELHQRTKHIDRRHFFVREMVEAMHISVPYVNTADNLADFFTKPLVPRTFLALRDKIMNVPRSESGGAV